MAVKKNLKPDVLCCPESPPSPDGALEGPQGDEDLARYAKAIGHPVRVRILRMLSRKDASVCSQIVGEIPLAQSTVSEHLRILKAAGLIRSSQNGTRVGYCIHPHALRRLRALIAVL